MNKIGLIQALREASGLPKTDVEKVVNLFFDTLAKALANGERVEIRGFFTLHVKAYKAFIGRNPKTGKKVKIASKKLPVFKAGKALKEEMNP
ncbi:integration host factor subunit beta [Desulfosarcina widdelii]|uniref:Integration host factor subunit beta n=1 Tax=Desulfosarcina widdelii TaxID=947919 RepID=A0A5K7ZAV4_9BACT|nr:HU family DNA-binding protein [Desulfosarcina widdelii]BBO77910.1 integration host factor subunit beta [Desulfosarcina widdelii]